MDYNRMANDLLYWMFFILKLFLVFSIATIWFNLLISNFLITSLFTGFVVWVVIKLRKEYKVNKQED